MDSENREDRAYRIGFLLIDGFALMSYAAASEPLRAANMLAEKELYNVRNIPVWGAQSESSSGAIVRASAQIGEQIDFDLVLVVAGGDPSKFNDARVFNWLRLLSSRGVMLGGVSGGPFILAKAGLMENRQLTIHWEHSEALAEISPLLRLEKNLYVVDRDRMTCAGGSAAMDMMHVMLTEHHGREFAHQVSDWFLHTQIRQSSAPQRSGLVERFGTNSSPVILAIEAMENHISEALNLSQLAKISGVGERQLNRLFQLKIGKGTMRFYRELRLEKAKQLLMQSPMSVIEISIATGFVSTAHFTKCFRTYFGQTPSSIRS